MHPNVITAGPGNCPICGMALVQRSGSPLPAASAAAAHVPADVAARTGVQVEPVEVVTFSPVAKATASIVADERLAVSLSPKVDGWIRRLGVSVVGQPVRRGQMLYEIFSPDLQQRQREYLDLLARRDSLQAQASGMNATPGGGSPDLMLASVARERFRARSRLLAADMPERLVDEIENSRRVVDVVPVLAERDGVVTSIGAREGAYVMPAQTVVAYADLSAIWAELNLDLPLLARLGSTSTAELRSPLDAQARAVVRVDPKLAVVDAPSRTARIRVPLPNGSRKFMPGTLAEAEVRLGQRTALAIPRDAVLHTGAGNLVMVALQGDHYEQRQVTLGSVSGNLVEVLEGLRAGERLVVNGHFLLSAEASMQSAAARTRGRTQ